jgi:hypothetical protein
MKTKPKPADPFQHRASTSDVHRHIVTAWQKQAPEAEAVDRNPKRAGRNAAATEADVRQSAPKTPRNGPSRPEQDDVHLVLSTQRGMSSTELRISKRCYQLCLSIAATFANCVVDGTSFILPIPGNQLREALERSVVRPRSDADCDSMHSLIDLLSQGQGLKIVRTINARDSHLSVGNR